MWLVLVSLIFQFLYLVHRSWRVERRMAGVENIISSFTKEVKDLHDEFRLPLRDPVSISAALRAGVPDA